MESIPDYFENLARFKEEFVRRLEDYVTDPGVLDVIPVTYLEILQRTGKMPWSIQADRLAHEIGEKLGINLTQLESVKREIFY